VTRKFTRNASAIRGIAPFIAVLTVMIALAALAQTGGTGQGSGSQGPLLFMPAVDYGSGGLGPESVVVADLNGDGKPDLIAANACTDGHCTGSSVGVLLGNGDGTFGTVVTYGSGGNKSSSVAVADVNRDGKLDIVVTNACADENCFLPYATVGVLLGNGDGTFQPAVTYSLGQTNAVVVADLNRDGKPDIVVVGDKVAVLLGNGDGTFQSPVTYNSGAEVGHSVAVADVNGDGKPDLLLGSICRFSPYTCTDLVGVMLGNGDGTLQPVVTYNSDDIYESSVAVADVNGDGKPDLLTANSNSGTAGVLLGNGDGTFQTVVTYDTGGDRAYSITAGDVNGDGKSDLVVGTSAGIAVLLGNGDGTFKPPVDYPSGGSVNGSYPNSVALADVNGDAKPDVLVANIDVLAVGVLLNNSGAPPTTTSLVSSVNPVTVKQVVTYTATVTPQSGGTLKGTVTFRDGVYTAAIVPLAGNQAAYGTSYKNTFAHAITATYSGDLHNAAGSRSDTLTENVRGTSKTVVTTSGSPSMYGQSVTFTATVTSSYGAIPDGETVTFYDGTTPLSSVPLAGGAATYATSALSGKTHTIKATYSGDAKLAPSTGSVKQVVEKYPTTATLTSSLNPSQFGQAVTFTAHVTSTGPAPTGSVKFLDGTTSIGLATLSGGVAKLTKSTLAVGTHPITAHYNGDAASSTSTSAVVNQVVQ
jgi:uncharacterized membrane protein